MTCLPHVWSPSTYPWILPIQAVAQAIPCHLSHTLPKSSCPGSLISPLPPPHFYRPTLHPSTPLCLMSTYLKSHVHFDHPLKQINKIYSVSHSDDDENKSSYDITENPAKAAAADQEYLNRIQKCLKENMAARNEREKRRRKVLIDQMRAHELQEVFKLYLFWCTVCAVYCSR